jgi:thiol-disulfide isomerase/thioredoxin
MKPILIVILLTAPMVVLSTAFGQDTIAVSLSRAVLPDTGQLTGITNIFFDSPDSLDSRYPRSWKNVEIAGLLNNPEFLPVSVIRYTDVSDRIHYVVATNADSSFNQEPSLTFRTVSDISIADARVRITRKASRETWDVAYQIILADKYVYARIAEYRIATIKIGQDHYSILLRPMGRNSPAFSKLGDILCFIDMNNDGAFVAGWTVTSSGTIIPSEEVSISEPFKIGGQDWQVASIDLSGSKLSLRRSSMREGLSIGFKAPRLQFKDLLGAKHDLGESRGKVVLLTFWSTSCHFCEMIRPALNSMVKRYSGNTFAAIALSRETDVNDVKNHLEKHAYEGIVGIPDATYWQRYNGRTITPLFYLIDQNGTLALIGPGASMCPVLQSMIQRLLAVR